MKSLSDPGLERTQRWMQAFILTPDVEDEAALQTPQVQAEIPFDEALGMVQPSLTLTAIERVGVYRGMYLARMGEALESDYPGVLHFLGAEKFYELAGGYLEAFPSRSYTLNRLGDRFPDFIAAQTDLSKIDFVHDLAKLEIALTEVFDAEESAVLTPEAIALVPPDAWERARLVPITAFRLIASRYPVSEYLGGVDEENPFPRIRKRQSWVVAYRKNFGLHRRDLTRPAFELLGALAAGMPVGEAVEKFRVSPKRLFEWFREWTAESLFQRVEY